MSLITERVARVGTGRKITILEDVCGRFDGYFLRLVLLYGRPYRFSSFFVFDIGLLAHGGLGKWLHLRVAQNQVPCGQFGFVHLCEFPMGLMHFGMFLTSPLLLQCSD